MSTWPPPSSSRELRSDVLRNQQTLIRAATAAVHREGLHVPMATIAADAGVGIGTLYRHFATREDLLSHLTHVSFEQVLANAQAAERTGATATEALQSVHRRGDQPAQRAGAAAARRTALHGARDPRRPAAGPPDHPADHRPRPGGRHHQAGRHPARHRRPRRDARPAAAFRPRLGRHLPSAARHLPRGPGHQQRREAPGCFWMIVTDCPLSSGPVLVNTGAHTKALATGVDPPLQPGHPRRRPAADRQTPCAPASGRPSTPARSPGAATLAGAEWLDL